VKYDDLNILVDYINDNNFTWNAEMNDRFKGLTLSELKDHKKVAHSRPQLA
jgi:hypothetical protein